MQPTYLTLLVSRGGVTLPIDRIPRVIMRNTLVECLLFANDMSRVVSRNHPSKHPGRDSMLHDCNQSSTLLVSGNFCGFFCSVQRPAGARMDPTLYAMHLVTYY